jgi:hypothetical protein
MNFQGWIQVINLALIVLIFIDKKLTVSKGHLDKAIREVKQMVNVQVGEVKDDLKDLSIDLSQVSQSLARLEGHVYNHEHKS